MSGDAPIPLLVWGASGHAKVLRPIFERSKRKVVALVERVSTLPSPFADVMRFTDERSVASWAEQHGATAEYILAIGGRKGPERRRLSVWLEQFGMRAFTAIHQSAFVADSATLGAGCHILQMATICEEVSVGSQAIINTRASVDHECVLGDGVHVMPGVTITGCVEIEDFATIGSGATILPRLKIGKGALVGAGAVVTKHVAPGDLVVGIPARSRPSHALSDSQGSSGMPTPERSLLSKNATKAEASVIVGNLSRSSE